MPISDENIMLGQQAYTKWNVTVQYDIVVLKYFNRLVWKCPTPVILDWYNKNISSNHLDVGVGTGFFLRHCKFPSNNTRLVIMDLNDNSLWRSANRLKKLKPEIYKQNILDDFKIEIPFFDSIGINYLLHCLPGDMVSKAKVFNNLKKLLNPEGAIFGSTILYGGVEHTKKGMKILENYNKKGVFSNYHDDLETLTKNLKNSFSSYEIKVVGSVALFSAKV